MPTVIQQSESSQAMTIRQQLRAWQPSLAPNPLPEPFEAQALRVFALRYPMQEWGNPLFKAERDAARGIARENALEVIASMTWTLDTAAPLLAEQSTLLCFGEDREIGPAVRAEVLSYAESYLEDLWPIVGRPVMSPGGIARNAADLRLDAARKVS